MTPTASNPWASFAVGVGVLVTMMTATATNAQDEGPIVINPRPEFEGLQLDFLDLWFEFEWRRDVDEVENPDGDTTRDREDRFREILGLSTGGYLGHPNLLQLDFTGRFGLTQRDFDLGTTGQDDGVDETLIEFDTAGRFFDESKIPLTLYARRVQNDISRQFGGSLESTLMEYGARLSLRDETFPTSIHVFRLEQEEVDQLGLTSYDLGQNTVALDGRVLIDDGQTIWWDYTFDDIDQSGQLRTTGVSERHEVNATHELKFGEQQQHNLRSRFRYLDESGDFDLEQIRLHEILRYRVLENLQTWVEYTDEHIDRTDLSQLSRDIRGRFRHELFESLVTAGQIGYQRFEVDTDNFTSDELFADLDFDYRKQVPYGTFFAGATFRFSERDESDRGSPSQIIDQVFVVGVDDLITIRQRNIIVSSIRITDIAGTRLFIENEDYTVRAFSDRVEIRRVLAGDIAPGQAVLIDYVIGPEPGGTTTTYGWGLDARYTFEEGIFRGLSFYTIYFEQDENRPQFAFSDSPDFEPSAFIANDFTELTYGVEYNDDRLNLKAERRIRDSELAPFESIRLKGIYTHPIGRGSSISLSAFYDEIDNTDISLVTRTTTVSGSWTQQFTPRLRTNIRLVWRQTDDTDDFETEAFEQYAELHWQYQQTTVFARIRNSIIDTNTSDRMFQEIFVGLRREF